ncbi:MAG: hypothetical protein NTW39_03660 [Actinobacteria bacterium]|nr:hypothetical protein [Actinomycetota bacterium]
MVADVAISQLQMKKIAKELSTRDKRLARVIDAHPLCTIGRNPKPVTHFEALVESVISQQLAVKAADTIYGRVKDLTKGRMVATRIADITEAQMRRAGVSGAKFKTIQGLADAALSKKININKLHEIEDDQLIFDQLTSLWGKSWIRRVRSFAPIEALSPGTAGERLVS